MKLNIKKCKVVHVGFKNPRIMYYMKDVTIGQSHALGKTDLERDLGVYGVRIVRSKESKSGQSSS